MRQAPGSTLQDAALRRLSGRRALAAGVLRVALPVTLHVALPVALLLGPLGPARAAADPVVALPPDPPPVTEAMFRPEPGLVRSPGRSLYLALLTREAERQGLPPAVADAVATVESSYNPNAVGGVGEVGLMQILPSTARMLGFRGGMTDLFEPETNVRLGVTYLAQAWRLTAGNLCETLMKYRAGHGEVRFSQRSVDYCVRARIHLAAIGSPLASAPVPEAVAIAAARPRPIPVAAAGAAGAARVRRPNRALWAAHTQRLKAIESKVSVSTLTIMAR